VCGIACARHDGTFDVRAGLRALTHRGPDASGISDRGPVTIGHTRLAILDLDPRSDQPFRYGTTTISYNGELWNYEELRATLEQLGHEFSTAGDTEVVAAALDVLGEEALPLMNGMFAVCWTDGTSLWAARDRYGEVPLHAAGNDHGAAFASELRAIKAMTGSTRAIWVEPGEVMTIAPDGVHRRRWYVPPIDPLSLSQDEAGATFRDLLELGCRERAISDVPVCALLSGGIDSSAIVYHLREHVPNLVAFTAVHHENARDLRCARQVASDLDVELIEVPVTVPTTEELRQVVRTIEMPFKAQVEIGWACLALAREMQASGFKVVFSGEGSDELWASYGFAYFATQQPTFDWHEYRRDLFVGQHRKNFARCNKVFLSHGVECRLPFLHPPLVEFALAVPPGLCYDSRPTEKRLIREAYRGLLPDAVIDRPKQAFQDGLGLKTAIQAAIHKPAELYRSTYASSYDADA
jgi:asparagine synthase (glutamine-hydrolysing)